MHPTLDSDSIAPVPFAPSPPILRLLGGLRIESTDASKTVSHESRFHVRALLALAGSACAGMGRDEIVELLWPKSDVTAARNRLYHTVHLARQALAAASWDDEWIVVRHARVVLDKRVLCDVHQLEQAHEQVLTSLSDDKLQNVLPLCKSDWMPDLDIGAAGQLLRGKIQNLQSGLLREAAFRSRREGSTIAHRELLLQLLRLQPTEEWAHRALMRLNLDMGRNHAVLRTYEALTKDLGLQLGLKPHPKTIEIAELAAERLLEKPVKFIDGQLMGVLAPQFLVGREALLVPLVKQIKSKAGVWNLYGLAGVGKTVIAHELVRRLPPSMTTSVFMVSMTSAMDLQGLSRIVLGGLGISLTERADEIATLRTIFLTRSVLVLIDDILPNFDFQPLLEKSSSASFIARILLVGQRRCGLLDAQLIHVPSFQGSEKETTSNRVLQSASFELFAVCCRMVGAETRSDRWRTEVLRLLDFLEGLPLAIELAAAHASLMTPMEMLAELSKSLSPLSGGLNSVSGRKGSLRSTFDHGLDGLSDFSRTAYWALSFFRGVFSYSDAVTALSTVGLGGRETPQALTELLESCYLEVVRDIFPLTLRMPCLVRVHAHEHAAKVSANQFKLAADAHKYCVSQQMSSLTLEFASPDYTTQFKQLINLESDALAVFKSTQIDDPATSVHMAAALFELWDTRSDEAAIAGHVESALLSANFANKIEQELRIRIVWVKHLIRIGNLDEAQIASKMLMEHPSCWSVKAMTSVRIAACRAEVLAKLGNAHLAQELCRQTKDRMGLLPDSDEFWVLQLCYSDLSHTAFKTEFDLNTLRPRFGGSRFWFEMLQSVFSEHRKMGHLVPLQLQEEARLYADIFQMSELTSAVLEI